MTGTQPKKFAKLNLLTKNVKQQIYKTQFNLELSRNKTLLEFFLVP